MNPFKRSTDVAVTPAAPDTTLGAGDVIRADSFGNRLRTGSSAALQQATDVYKKNPKLVGGLAVLAGALLLNRMRSRSPRA